MLLLGIDAIVMERYLSHDEVRIKPQSLLIHS